MFAVVPILLTGWSIAVTFHNVDMRAVDFHHEFWPAARRLLDGQSPYDSSWQRVGAGVAFPYPALTAAAFVPFAFLPLGLADGLYTALNLTAIVLTLVVLGVRDWRVFGLVLLWAPVAAAWQSANLTLLFALGLAGVWRTRNRPLLSGLLVAVLVSVKPFVWPIVVWLAVTRRWAALGWTAVCGAALNLAVWTSLGLGQLGPYRTVVQHVTAVMQHRGYTVVNLVFHLGGGSSVAYLVTALATCAVLCACLLVAARGDDQAALALSVAAALVATPVAWTHYFALAVVPLALARPRLGVLWFLPVALWLCPSTAPATWQIILAGGVVALVIGTIVRRPNVTPQLVAAPRAAWTTSS
jgi:alpha-1,2-mannosyltransferase